MVDGLHAVHESQDEVPDLLLVAFVVPQVDVIGRLVQENRSLDNLWRQLYANRLHLLKQFRGPNWSFDAFCSALLWCDKLSNFVVEWKHFKIMKWPSFSGDGRRGRGWYWRFSLKGHFWFRCPLGGKLSMTIFQKSWNLKQSCIYLVHKKVKITEINYKQSKDCLASLVWTLISDGSDPYNCFRHVTSQVLQPKKIKKCMGIATHLIVS